LEEREEGGKATSFIAFLGMKGFFAIKREFVFCSRQLKAPLLEKKIAD